MVMVNKPKKFNRRRIQNEESDRKEDEETDDMVENSLSQLVGEEDSDQSYEEQPIRNSNSWRSKRQRKPIIRPDHVDISKLDEILANQMEEEEGSDGSYEDRSILPINTQRIGRPKRKTNSYFQINQLDEDENSEAEEKTLDSDAFDEDEPHKMKRNDHNIPTGSNKNLTTKFSQHRLFKSSVRAFKDEREDSNQEQPIKKLNEKKGTIEEFDSLKDKKDNKPIPVPKFRVVDIYDRIDIPDPTQHKFYIKPLFQLPTGHYLRTNEAIPEPNSIIEYDLDLEDKAWIELLNNGASLSSLPEEVSTAFEFFMDALEKNWFEYSKKADQAHAYHISEPNPDAPCEICKETDCENSNAIVFCDGCDLAVHQDCYGVPYIPEGQWLCRKCMLSPSYPVECIFCPNEGGAFKQTVLNSWAHVTCTLWIPEVSFGNTVYMEPVEGIDKVPKSRWKLSCYLCKQKHGACIQCVTKTCSTAFHVTCASIAKLSMRYKATQEGVHMKAHCHKHTPKDHKQTIDIGEVQKQFSKRFRAIKKRKTLLSDNDQDEVSPRSNPSTLQESKSARAHQHSFMATQAYIPNHIYQKVLNSGHGLKVRKKATFLSEICKYWSLKKESCRGAPLIKRLHLEPWTASKNPLKTEEEKVKFYQDLTNMRYGLEKVRMLIELVKQREAYKLNRDRVLHSYWEKVFFPHALILKTVLNTMIRLDQYGFFTQPVSLEEVPDYLDHIKKPMDLETLSDQLYSRIIDNLESFKENLLLIYTNCMAYNNKSTTYYKTAMRHHKTAQNLLEEAEQKIQALPINPTTKLLDVQFDIQQLFTNQPTIPPSPSPEIEIDSSPHPTTDVKIDSESDKPITPLEKSTTPEKKKNNLAIVFRTEPPVTRSKERITNTTKLRSRRVSKFKPNQSKLELLPRVTRSKPKQEDGKQTKISSFIKRSRVPRN